MNIQHKAAICYDFDGTLSPRNMQEYDYLPLLGVKPKDFWEEMRNVAKETPADTVLAYMYLMVKYAKKNGILLTRDLFREHGANIEFFPGVTQWFERVNGYAAARGIKLEHYVISAGIEEMVEGCRIANEFTKIYASSFIYDSSGDAVWPATAVNYTTKTQFLFRINKGCPNIWEADELNARTPDDKRAIPFKNMIFIGDGDSDIPSMHMVKERGGFSCAVHKSTAKSLRNAEFLMAEGRVDVVASADYRKDSVLDVAVMKRIDDLSKLTKIQD